MTRAFVAGLAVSLLLGTAWTAPAAAQPAPPPPRAEMAPPPPPPGPPPGPLGGFAPGGPGGFPWGGPGACGHVPGDIADMYNPARARLIVAILLGGQEIAIGITPEQSAAWRAYTDAVIAMLPTGARLAAFQAREHDAPATPFALPEAVADAILANADAARRLKDAVVALRATLTPEQMARAELPRELMMQRLAATLSDRFAPPDCAAY
ncbi:Spy/CpxP family protein refolding chaperone [Aquabacter spiritensis]|uniref:LTXXQ motif family protein n=1 Tax=Aquabacter spiritensis TaxID=933073 RepID=A0A4R3LUM2_9HYPH|nr:Spy/CpxP family protein refolding chaperone [Aquabacter spiritensis]TCT04252.1 LTXXQ motif family protein [Aquabacter spiritensis]